MGKLIVVPIGSPDSLLESCALNQTTPDDLRHLFAKRIRNSNKGMYGHVLVAGGSSRQERRPRHDRARRLSQWRGPGDCLLSRRSLRPPGTDD